MKESENSRGEEGLKGVEAKAFTNPDEYVLCSNYKGGQEEEGLKGAEAKAFTNTDDYGGQEEEGLKHAPVTKHVKAKAVVNRDEHGLLSNYKVIVREDGVVEKYSFGRIIPSYIDKSPEPLDINSGFESSGPAYQRCAWGDVVEKKVGNEVVDVQAVKKKRCELPVTVSRRVQNRRSFWMYALAMARKYQTVEKKKKGD